MTTGQVVKWAAGVTSGITTGVISLIWIYSTFLTKESHRVYIEVNEKWNTQALTSIKEDINDIKTDVRELKGAIIGKKVAGILTTNLHLFP